MTYCSFLLVHNTYTYFGCLERFPRGPIHSIKPPCLCCSTVLIAPPGWIFTVRITKVFLYNLANFNSQYYVCLHVRAWHIVSFSKCCFNNYLVALVLFSFLVAYFCILVHPPLVTAGYRQPSWLIIPGGCRRGV